MSRIKLLGFFDVNQTGHGSEVVKGLYQRFFPGSRLKGMPQKDLINIRNYDVRHLIPKVCSAVLKNGAEILIESIVK